MNTEENSTPSHETSALVSSRKKSILVQLHEAVASKALDEEIKKCHKLAKKRSNLTMQSVRAELVLKALEAESITELMSDRFSSFDTIRRWLSRFIVYGVNGLNDEPRVGATSAFANDELCIVIKAFILYGVQHTAKVLATEEGAYFFELAELCQQYMQGRGIKVAILPDNLQERQAKLEQVIANLENHTKWTYELMGQALGGYNASTIHRFMKQNSMTFSDCAKFKVKLSSNYQPKLNIITKLCPANKFPLKRQLAALK